MENNEVNPQDKFISSWSWGAFFLGFIWALTSRLYLYGVLMFVGSFIPLVNLVIWIYFAIAGRKVAWTKGKWQSFAEYEKRQRLLSAIGVTIFLGIILIMFFLSATAIISFVARQYSQTY